MTVRAIIYLRLSDLRADDFDENGEVKSFPARKQALREFAERLGWTVVGTVVENDVTPGGKRRGVSAFKRKRVILPDGSQTFRVIRPGFQSIIKDLWAGAANGLIAEDLDRVFRDPRDLEDFIDVAEVKGVNARSQSGSLTFTDGGTDSEITLARNMVSFANKSSRDTRRRVAAERRRQAHSGRFGGGRRPFGFEPDGVTPRADEYSIIATASHRVLQGVSLRALAAELRESGAPSTGGAPWSAETLRAVLLRPRNAGIMVYRGEEVGAAPWDPIVPADVFRAVVRALTDPNRATTPGAAPTYVGSGIYLCGVCDDGTSVEVTTGQKYPRYRCKAKAHLSRAQAHVDSYVLDTVAARLALPDAVSLFARPQSTTPDVDAVALRFESESIRANLRSLAEDFAMSLIDREMMIAATAKAKTRLAEIDQALAVTPVDSPVIDLLGAKDIRKALDDLPLSLRRIVVSTVAQVIIVPSSRRGRGFDPEAVLIDLDKSTWKQFD